MSLNKSNISSNVMDLFGLQMNRIHRDDRPAAELWRNLWCTLYISCALFVFRSNEKQKKINSNWNRHFVFCSLFSRLFFLIFFVFFSFLFDQKPKLCTKSITTYHHPIPRKKTFLNEKCFWFVFHFSSLATPFNRPFIIRMQQSNGWWHWIDCRKSTKITSTRFVMVSTYNRCITWIYCMWPQSIGRTNIGSVSLMIEHLIFKILNIVDCPVVPNVYVTPPNDYCLIQIRM